jgi:hypothetical protein
MDLKLRNLRSFAALRRLRMTEVGNCRPSSADSVASRRAWMRRKDFDELKIASLDCNDRLVNRT